MAREDLMNTVQVLIDRGLSIRDACRQAKVSRSTFQRWQTKQEQKRDRQLIASTDITKANISYADLERKMLVYLYQSEPDLKWVHEVLALLKAVDARYQPQPDKKQTFTPEDYNKMLREVFGEPEKPEQPEAK